MSPNIIKKMLWYITCLLACNVLGVLMAPLGVPLVQMFVQGDNADFTPLFSFMGSQDVFSSATSFLSKVIADPALFSFLVVWCVALSTTLTLSMLFAYRKKTSRNVEDGILGDARLIKDKATIKCTNDFWNGKGEPKSAGLVLSSSPQGYFYDDSVQHWCGVGKTGSGKTQLMIINSLHLMIAKGWNLIVTGKNELLELTGEKVVELGYRRIIFDLKGYPCASRFNPLELIIDYIERGERGKAQRTARQLSADLIPLHGESNPYFPKAARSLLAAILLIVAMADIPREQKNMTSVLNVVNVGTTGEGEDSRAPLKDYIRSDAVGPAHPAYGLATDFLQDGGKTTAGKNVLSTLQEGLSIFNDEGIARITATSDVPIIDIIRDKTIVYMHLLEEGDPYLVLETIFLNQWWRVAQEEASRNAGRLPRETAILGDEWGNLPKVSGLPEMVTLGRSYDLHVYCFTQNLKQWNKYNDPGDQGAGREKILGSMGGKIALSLANPEDFQYFTRLAGKHTVKTQNTSTSKQSSAGGVSSSSSESFSEQAIDLIHEWDWQNRIPVRDGIICIKGGENSKPGREGVFEMPVEYASKTPAGTFFDLGDKQACAEKQIAFRKEMERAAAEMAMGPVPYWIPDFAAYRSSKRINEGIAADEASAWEEV